MAGHSTHRRRIDSKNKNETNGKTLVTGIVIVHNDTYWLLVGNFVLYTAYRIFPLFRIKSSVR